MAECIAVNGADSEQKERRTRKQKSKEESMEARIPGRNKDEAMEKIIQWR